MSGRKCLLRILAACLLVVAIVHPCLAQNNTAKSSSSGSATALRIGIILPLSGQHKALGQELLMGIEYALTQAPAEVSSRVSLLYEDDACDVEQSKAAYLKLQEQEKVSIVLGPVCPDAIAAIGALASKSRQPVVALLFGHEHVATNEQLYLLGYDTQREAALVQKTAKRSGRAIALVVDSSQGLELTSFSGVKPQRTLELASAKSKQIAEFVRYVSAKNTLMLLSRAATLHYSRPVAQLMRLSTPVLLDSGVWSASRVYQWSGRAGLMSVGPDCDYIAKRSESFRTYLTEYYNENLPCPFVAAVAYEAMSLVLEAMADSIDVHEAIRVLDYQAKVLPLQRLENGREFLSRPVLRK